MKAIEKRNLSLEEFKASTIPDAWAALQRLEGKGELLTKCRTFSECHVRVREQTGLWIEDLVPVFQKLDASIALHR